MGEDLQCRRLMAATVGLLCVVCFASPFVEAQSSEGLGEWPVFGGNPANTKYSPLDQITAENFSDLEIAWRWTSLSAEGAERNEAIRPRPFKTTPLMVAGLVYVSTSLGQVAAMDERVDVDDFQTSSRSPLLVASASMVATSGFEYRLVIESSGHEEFAMFLLEQGADPSTPDSIGRTPLHAAVETGKRELVQALLAHGADLNARLVDAPLPFRGDFVGYRRYVGATPVWLGAAARVPDVDILRDLVSAGADTNLAADDRTTPLMAAIGMVQNEARLAPESESLAVVRLLVELGVDVNATSRDGQTAMHGAARLARNSVISVLVEHGGQVNTADARGRTPLDVGTVSRPLQPDTAELLKSLGGYSGLERSNQR